MKRFLIALMALMLVSAPALAAVTEILDTTGGDTGATFDINNAEQRKNRTAHIQCDIGSGDTVQLQGRLNSSYNWVSLEEMTADTLKQVDLPNQYRAVRTVDGTTADSTCSVEVF